MALVEFEFLPPFSKATEKNMFCFGSVLNDTIWLSQKLFCAHVVKFTFSEKATKIDKIFTVNLTVCSNCQIDGEDFVNFCGLLRKYELYSTFDSFLASLDRNGVYSASFSAQMTNEPIKVKVF